MKRKFVEITEQAGKALRELRLNSIVHVSEKSLVSALILYAKDTGLNLMLFNPANQGKEKK